MCANAHDEKALLYYIPSALRHLGLSCNEKAGPPPIKNCLIRKARYCTYILQRFRSPYWSFGLVCMFLFFVVRSRVAEHLGARGRVELIKFDSNLPPPSSSFCEAIVSFSWVCNWPFKLTSEDVRTEKNKAKKFLCWDFLIFSQPQRPARHVWPQSVWICHFAREDFRCSWDQDITYGIWGQVWQRGNIVSCPVIMSH